MGRQLRPFRAVIIGPPGSGKGFISQKIVKKYGCNHISTGDLLRKHIAQRSKIGIVADKYIQKGQLVPDYLLTQTVNSTLDRIDNVNFLLDGYPRTLDQAQNLSLHTKLDFVINIMLPPAAILKKIRNRLVHPQSGRVYSVEGPNKPLIAGRDNITGDRLVRRSDDDPEIWIDRLKIYNAKMLPIIKYYNAQNLSVTFHVRHHENLWPSIKRYLVAKWLKVV